MPIRSYPGRVLFVAVSSSLLVLVICGTIAYTLYGEQDRTAAALQEDIGSRGAAINMEATLNNLALLHDRKSRDLEPLHEKVRSDLAEIQRFVNKDEERRLALRVNDRFDEYLRLWRNETPSGELASFLRSRALPEVEALRIYNGQELKQSEQEHLQSLRRMAWGLALVGGLGSFAGLVLGYGLARSLRRTIHQFLVRIQGASDLLGQEVPTVEWERTGEPLGDGGEHLLRRVEQVVSKLQQRERDVRRNERLAAVGQLAAGVAHEIRNPLTSVILLLETSRKDATAGGLSEEDFALIETELHRIEQSLQTLLDYARPPKLRRRDVNFAEIVQDAVKLCGVRIEQQRVEVKIDAPPAGVMLSADWDQLRQVVLNLILNALDMMPHGGTLCLQVKPRAESGTIELAVNDTGPGVRDDILPRLFEPFATGKETGVGLGLVVTKRIVEDHGGTIRGFNAPGGGASFVVNLPRASPERS